MKLFLFFTFLINNLYAYSFLHVEYPNSTSFLDFQSNDVIINSDTTIQGGLSYQYNNLTINAGKNLIIDSDNNDTTEQITVIKVKDTLVLNGTINATKGTHAGGDFFTIQNGIKFQITQNQSNGGYGGSGGNSNGSGSSGSSQGYGNGGGGGGGGASKGGCMTDDNANSYGRSSSGSFYQGGYGGRGGDPGGTGQPDNGALIYGNNGTNGLQTCGGGNGGGGGSRGYHGGLLIIIANKIIGNGVIDLHGSNGGAGGNGGPGNYGVAGGGAGGGAGGNGGVIWFVTKNNSFTGNIILTPGTGGAGGSGANYGTNGSTGSIGNIINIKLK